MIVALKDAGLYGAGEIDVSPCCIRTPIHLTCSHTSEGGWQLCRMQASVASPAAGLTVPTPAHAMRERTAADPATMPTPAQAPHCTLMQVCPATRKEKSFLATLRAVLMFRESVPCARGPLRS